MNVPIATTARPPVESGGRRSSRARVSPDPCQILPAHPSIFIRNRSLESNIGHKVRPITRLRLFLATLVLAVALELGLTTVLEVPKTEAGESRPDTPENLTAGADVFGAMTTSDPMRLAAVDKMINQRSGP